MKLNEIKEIGTRGVLFTFEFGDCVYLIKGKNRLFLCDTNEGVSSMAHVKEYIKKNDLENKELIVFNSHSDWDHIWGNEAFEGSIVASTQCLNRMKERSLYDLEVMKNYHDGTINLKYPTITFSGILTFIDEDVEFIYAPSHTICSSICYDKLDQVIYAGDILEAPIPMLNHLNLADYKKSLEMIKALNAKIVITTHSSIVNDELMTANYQYVCDFMDGLVMNFEDEFSPIRHGFNMKNMLVLKYEQLIKNKLGEQFIFSEVKKDLWNFFCEKNPSLVEKRLWDIRQISIVDIESYLKEFLYKK